MQITQTIELSDEERLTVQRFLKIADIISDTTGCSIDDVLLYFANKADASEDGCSVSALHQIADIGAGMLGTYAEGDVHE